MAETLHGDLGSWDLGLLAGALMAAESAVFVMETGRGVVLFNPAAAKLFRCPSPGTAALAEWERSCVFHSEDVEGKRSRRRIDLPDLPWNRALRGENIDGARYFIRDGERRAGVWVQLSALRSSGEPERVFVSAQDISKWRRTEVALQSVRRMTRALFNENRAPIIRTTADGRVLACNLAFAHMLGYRTTAEVRALRAQDFYARDNRAAVIAEVKKKGSIHEYTFEFRRKDGTKGSAITSVQWVEPLAGESEWSIVTTMVDQSGHREAETARANLQIQLRAFMRFFPGIAFIKDRDGKYMYRNESSLAALGMKDGDAAGKTDEEIWPPHFAAEFRRNDREVMASGQAVRVTEEVPLADGIHRWTVYRFPIPDETGEPHWLGGIGVDDTERLKLESRLQEAERMEAVGRLAGGIAHDFNNLLTVIAGYGQMLNDALSRQMPTKTLQIYVDELLAASSRATNLTDQLLAFGRRQQVKMQRLDLNEQVNSAVNLLRRVIGEQIDLVVQTSAMDCFVRADAGQIGQVVMNLAVNARDAMPQGGLLSIETDVTTEPPEGVAPGQFVVLRVRDSGMGMDSATRLRIFEPFFTSKPKGKGTGLGLSTVYGIVKQAGAEIVVDSKPGVGSVFQIYFPECPADGPCSAAGVTESAPDKNLGGSETILVVEDDANVRSLVKAMLERYGFHTLMAEDGKDAVRVFEACKTEVHLLLTDVVMPHMSGRELAGKLQSVAPGLKVMYMSGYAADEMASKGVTGRLNVLRKPFDADTLARRVREVLN